MTPSKPKWPEYQPADGNVYQWILKAAQRARGEDHQRERHQGEIARIEHRARTHGQQQDQDRE